MATAYHSHLLKHVLFMQFYGINWFNTQRVMQPNHRFL
jgi:hypothetical protein